MVEPPLKVQQQLFGMSRNYYVYILASETRELYIGVTNNLERRLAEHRSGYSSKSYSLLHGTRRLVHFESTPNVLAAIQREKQLKRWNRQRKLALIECRNPEWRDLAEDWL
jgi:putative endonuclease